MTNGISAYVVTSVLAWAVAQGIKGVLKSVRPGSKKGLKNFVGSGGMPSSHTAIIVALLSCIGTKLGLGSVEFGIVFALALIIIYDALDLRRSVGEQGRILHSLLTNKDKTVLHISNGHTLIEVIAGAGLGVVVGVCVASIL
jgi:acid phosphatase family membrane protein YuiD